MDKNAITTIFVCSPYRPQHRDPSVAKDQLAANVERVKLACRMLVKLGYLPLAPHLYFTEFLDDHEAKERAEGMALGLEWLAQSDELWVFGEEISGGMSTEISYAKQLGIPVKQMPEPTQLLADLLEEIHNKHDKERKRTKD
jgi:hypothetical protein